MLTDNVRSLFGLPAAALAGSVIDLRDLVGPLAAELLQRLQASSTWTDRFDIIDEVLQRMLKPCPPARDLVWASGRLTAAVGGVPIAELARELGFSRRHFSERFHSEFGLAPKTFARVLRFEHACALIKRRQGTLAQVATAAGFSDQTHMTKEWLRLAGCTPKLWTAQELPFLQDYELAALEDMGRPCERSLTRARRVSFSAGSSDATSSASGPAITGGWTTTACRWGSSASKRAAAARRVKSEPRRGACAACSASQTSSKPWLECASSRGSGVSA